MCKQNKNLLKKSIKTPELVYASVSWDSLVAQTVKRLRDLGSIPGSGRSPGEGNGNPFLVLLPRKFHGWRNLVSYIQSMGLQRVGYGWVTSLSFFLFHDVLRQLSSFQLIFAISLRWSLYHSHESGCRQVSLFLELQWGKGW